MSLRIITLLCLLNITFCGQNSSVSDSTVSTESRDKPSHERDKKLETKHSLPEMARPFTSLEKLEQDAIKSRYEKESQRFTPDQIKAKMIELQTEHRTLVSEIRRELKRIGALNEGSLGSEYVSFIGRQLYVIGIHVQEVRLFSFFPRSNTSLEIYDEITFEQMQEVWNQLIARYANPVDEAKISDSGVLNYRNKVKALIERLDKVTKELYKFIGIP